MPNEPNRWYCFTINNPTDDDDKQLVELSSHSRYLIYAQEHFEKENATPHYQGYVEFDKPKRFSWLRGIISRAHIEPRRGSRTQARDYCFKECANPTEYGTWKPDRQGQRNDLVAIQKRLDEGTDMLTIAREHFGSWVKNRKSFAEYQTLIRLTRRSWKTKVIVYYGPPGSGKTRRVYKECPEVHDMHYRNGFWSTYRQQENVLIDDFEQGMLSRNTFLKLTDRYPLKIRVLHDWSEWVPKVIYITSNTHPDMWFNGDPAVKRRIDKIVEIKLV